MSSTKDKDSEEVCVIPAHKIVRFENTLNAAAQDLTISEQRILFSAISKIGKDQVITRDSLFEITEEDIKKLAADGEYTKGIYARMTEGADRLMNRIIMIPDAVIDLSGVVDPKPKRRSKDEKFTKVDCAKIHPVSFCAYQKGEGRIFLQFHEQFLPYVSNLRDNFYTMYRLTEIRGLKSRYSIPLYSMMMQFMHEKGGGLNVKKGGWFQIEVQELRRRLVAEKIYPRMHDFQKNLLDPVVKELSESPYTTFTVTYKCIHKGRKITHIAFSMKAKDDVNQVVVDDAEAVETEPPAPKIILSEAQARMFADKLAGKNKKVNESGEFSSADFISDLYRRQLVPHGYFTGSDINDAAEKLRVLLLTKLNFADAILDPWLKKVGYKASKAKK